MSKVIPDNPRVELARELDALREEAHIPLRELGERSKFSRTTLCDATKGKRVPTKAVVLGFVRGCVQGYGKGYREAQERKFLLLWEKADQWERTRREEDHGESL